MDVDQIIIDLRCPLFGIFKESMLSSTHIVLADERHLTRNAICAALQQNNQLHLIAEVISLQELLSLSPIHPSTILLISWPLFSATVEEIGSLWPDVKIIIIGTVVDDLYIHELLSLGVKACYLQEDVVEALLLAIHTVTLGATWFSWPVVHRLIQPATPPLLTNTNLTKRESEVLYLLVQGQGNKEMAFKLGIAERTVEFHVGHILEKLNISSRLEAALWAKEHGW